MESLRGMKGVVASSSTGWGVARFILAGRKLGVAALPRPAPERPCFTWWLFFGTVVIPPCAYERQRLCLGKKTQSPQQSGASGLKTLARSSGIGVRWTTPTKGQEPRYTRKLFI